MIYKLILKKGSLIFMSVLLIGISAAGCSKPEQEFDRVKSPAGNYEIFVTVTEPALPHGKHKIKIYAQKNDEPPIALADTTLENDGVPFTKKNIGLRWTSGTTALVCLRATDLGDHGVRINVKDTPTAKIEPGC